MTNFLKLHPDGVLHMTIKLILIVFEGWVNMRLSHGLVTTWSHSMRHSLAIQNYNGHVLKNYHYKELFSKTILVESHIFFNYLGSVWRARKCSRCLAGALAKKKCTIANVHINIKNHRWMQKNNVHCIEIFLCRRKVPSAGFGIKIRILKYLGLHNIRISRYGASSICVCRSTRDVVVCHNYRTICT